MTPTDTTLQDPALAPDLTDCDREPIRTPEAIQAHGVMLVVDQDTGRIERMAGDVVALSGAAVQVGDAAGPILARGGVDGDLSTTAATGTTALGRWRPDGGAACDVSAFRAGDRIVVEIERTSDADLLAADRLTQLDRMGAAFEGARTVADLCAEAARAFRELTGFDRVMVYRFLDDDSGQVLAEDRAPGMASFMNQHFPASDIPRQARALYVRNMVRVIPDVTYQPQPLSPAAGAPLDLSDSVLRSVSPIHVRYLRNMGVGASASISIVMDGHLWGLIACHNAAPRMIGREARSAAVVLARGLSRQLKARDDAESYRARARSRDIEEALLAGLPLDADLGRGLAESAERLMDLMQADGLAVVVGGQARTAGRTPSDKAVTTIADWVRRRPDVRPVATRRLSGLMPAAEAWTREASGLIGLSAPGVDDLVLLWFRAEHVETVRWAGDPHAGVKRGPLETLTPRASFDAWAETVRGQSRPWAPAEVESAARLRDALADLGAVRALHRQTRDLTADVADRDQRLLRQDFLMREVNHRVQNSLQLVSSFLALSAREHGTGPGRDVLEEARRRVKAVSLVHSRLYRAEQTEAVDLGHYLQELTDDLSAASGEAWARSFSTDFAPVMVEPDRAVTFGLIFTELVINAQKYAYGGEPGPVGLRLELLGGRARLSVADRGVGSHTAGKGFGSRMVESMAEQLGGTIDYRTDGQGLTADLIAPARLDTRV